MLGCKIDPLMIDYPTGYSHVRTLCLVAEQGSPVQIPSMIARLLLILQRSMPQSSLELERVLVPIQSLIQFLSFVAAFAELLAIRESD